MTKAKYCLLRIDLLIIFSYLEIIPILFKDSTCDENLN